MKILLIEDDDTSSTLLTRSLNSQHHIVDVVKDGEMGWTYASTFDYDSIVLDIVLPKLDGISLCKRLREAGYATPILLLTAQDNITAKVQGLDAGADDYLVKPFDIAELMARMRALRRRRIDRPSPLFSWGDLLLDPSTCEVTYNGIPLNLTTKEYDLLELFLRDSFHVFSSDEIIDKLWSSDDFPAEATVRSHLRRLRHKLQAAGAPPDSIATIHGRGYYLKLPQPDLALSASPSADEPIDSIADTDSKPFDLHQHQAAYLAFLKDTWIATKPECLERLKALTAIVDRLRVGNCTDVEQQQIHQQVHKLGLTPTEAEILPTLLAELIAEIEHCEPSQTSTVSHADLPLLLLVDLDPSFTQSLQVMADDRGFRTLVLSTIEAAKNYLTTLPDDPIHPLAPTVVLVSLPTSRKTRTTLDFSHNLHQRFPNWPIWVLGEQDGWNERLAVVRHGGKFIATSERSIEQIFLAVTAGIQPVTAVPKVMIVDDDLDWLRALPKLLEPWDLKVTTLADPQQFWTVLQSVRPDALVLDLKMPEINGLELCQILRSDPHWQRLPILFLSAATNPLSQQEAFRVGADDYLCKPIVGGELAQRIHHRLARLQS
jgi:DNA-binding response OmpR family regulator